VLLVDNGRTKLLADKDKRQSLYCIRCGACLNHCPVYRKIGGHNYPWIYSGPIGAIITPQFHGVSQDPWLPFASSLCGACAEVCPVKIEIPKLLLQLRSEVTHAKERKGQGGMERLGFNLFAWVARRPRLFALLGSLGAGFMPRDKKTGWAKIPGFLQVGPLKNWISQRELPAPAAKSFRQLWRERK
jgi:L-lactate dehydrogenase complex protein LldF